MPSAGEDEVLALSIRKSPSHGPVSAMLSGSRRHCCTVFGSLQARPGDDIRDRLLVNMGERSHFYCMDLT